MHPDSPIDLLYEHALDLNHLQTERNALEQRIRSRCAAVRRLLPAGANRRFPQLSVSVYKPGLRYDIVDPQRVPTLLWSRRPDRDRIAAAFRGGMDPIPGVVCRSVPPRVVVRVLRASRLDPKREEG